MKQIKKRTESYKGIKWFIECPVCKNEIQGSSEGHAIANLRLHYNSKHPDKKFEKEVSAGI